MLGSLWKAEGNVESSGWHLRVRADLDLLMGPVIWH